MGGKTYGQGGAERVKGGMPMPGKHKLFTRWPRGRGRQYPNVFLILFLAALQCTISSHEDSGGAYAGDILSQDKMSPLKSVMMVVRGCS